MKWHKSESKPSIDIDTALCIVELKDEYPNYEIVRWHKRASCFCKQHNTHYSIKDENIVRWAYIEENDDIIEELYALLAISSAVSHVQELVDTLLTDGIGCGKEYRDIIGLNDLDSFKGKISKRIVALDTKDESPIDTSEDDVLSDLEDMTSNDVIAEEEDDASLIEVSTKVSEDIEKNKSKKEKLTLNDILEVTKKLDDKNNKEDELPKDTFIVSFNNKEQIKHAKVHKVFFMGKELNIDKVNGKISLQEILKRVVQQLDIISKGCIAHLCEKNWNFIVNGVNPALSKCSYMSKEYSKCFTDLYDGKTETLKGCYVFKIKDSIYTIKCIEELIKKLITDKPSEKEFYVIASH